MNLNVRQLEAFVSLVRHGGFSRAADKLHMSQAGLSILIKRLEERLDVRLFDRQARQLTLTPMGERLLPLAVRVLEEAETMLSVAKEEGETDAVNLRLAIAPALAVFILPSVLRQFSEHNKKATVNVIECANDQLVEQLRDNQVDFGLAYGMPSGRELISQVIAREKMIAVCTPDHPLMKREELRWTDLIDYPLIAAVPGNQSRTLIEAVFTELGVTFLPQFSASNLLTIVELASRRLGVAIVSTCVMPAVIAGGLAARVLSHPVKYRELSLVRLRNKGHTLPAAWQEIIDLLRDAMSDEENQPSDASFLIPSGLDVNLV
jgi:DNA-binding transcriptional LysR family regulator